MELRSAYVDISTISESAIIQSAGHGLGNGDATLARQQNQPQKPAKLSRKLTEKLRISPEKRWQRLQVGCLIAVLAFVWGLLSLPVIFYHLPQDQVCDLCLVIHLVQILTNTLH